MDILQLLEYKYKKNFYTYVYVSVKLHCDKISLILHKAKAKLRPSVNIKIILWVHLWFNWYRSTQVPTRVTRSSYELGK